MNCEMCGRETEELYKTNVEGTIMALCIKCSKFGKVIEAPKRPAPAARAIRRMVELPKKPEIIETVVNDYAEKIRKARERLGLNQEEFAKKVNEKISIIHKLETGSITPDLKTAKKLEKILHIKLTEEASEGEVVGTEVKESTMTLGDLMRLKK